MLGRFLWAGDSLTIQCKRLWLSGTCWQTCRLCIEICWPGHVSKQVRWHAWWIDGRKMVTRTKAFSWGRTEAFNLWLCVRSKGNQQKPTHADRERERERARRRNSAVRPLLCLLFVAFCQVLPTTWTQPDPSCGFLETVSADTSARAQRQRWYDMLCCQALTRVPFLLDTSGDLRDLCCSNGYSC